MTDPSFTRLLDWVEGRLSASEGAAVAALVDASPEAAERVVWIREFHAAGTSMPLETPPEGLRDDLRAAFRRHVSGPTGVGSVSEMRGGDGQPRAASGMRSGEDDEPRRIVLEGDGAVVSLSVIGQRPDVIDLHGILTWDGSSPRPEIVVSGPEIAHRRVTRPEATGEFRIFDVPQSIVEVWVVGPTSTLHGSVDLRADH